MDTHSLPSASTAQLSGMLLEQNDEWAARRTRYTCLEKLAQLGDDPQAGPHASRPRNEQPSSPPAQAINLR